MKRFATRLCQFGYRSLRRWLRRRLNGYALEYDHLESWVTAVPRGWTGPAATARFEVGITGGEHLEGIQRNGAWAPVVRDTVEALERTGLAEALVLDYGCGSGLYREILKTNAATSAWTYVGADINAAIVDLCRRRDTETRYEVVTEGQPLPFPDATFDVVLASGVFQCVSHPEALLAEFRRITRDWVLLSRLPVRKFSAPAIYLQTVWHKWGQEQHPIHVFRRNELEAMIVRNGLEIECRDHGVECFTVPCELEPVPHVYYLLRTSGMTDDY
jgi:SAM-dependent methyltransferase